MTAQFDDPDLADTLDNATPEELDDLDFGVVAMDRSGVVVQYNRFESTLSGLSVTRVVGRNFFEAVGPCTNNHQVAHRYRDEPDLDDTLDYVFTYRMAPTPVRIRLLARSTSDRQYLVVRRRDR